MKQAKSAISPKREENFPEWYQQVIKAAELAEASPVRGCMVIRPWGYGLWENMQQIMDGQLKATGHQNAYFPLFIPMSYMAREAAHVEGFAKECAVVTHSRLEAGPDGALVPGSPLEEPLVVRPTSETIIGETFAKWVQSYRDLPLLINQWANIVRWEMRTRMFLRTTEFLWQEGHTAHASEEEAREETLMILKLYADFAEQQLAMPVITGEKTTAERFPGAVATYSIEAMMQDGKALQSGTTHFLGQNFSRSAEIKFLNTENLEEFAWTTSWGVSTRLVGGVIMTHGDDDGLMLPPRVAPAPIVILPVLHKEETRAEVLAYCERLADELRAQTYAGRHLNVELDTRDMRGGEKTWSWIKKGVPVRLEVGPRDMADDAVFVGRRDRTTKERYGQPRAEFIGGVTGLLDEIQDGMFQRALDFQQQHTERIDSKDEFYEFFTPQKGSEELLHGGFAFAHWSGEAEVEEQIKNDLNVTIRNIPTSEAGEAGVCPFSGKPSPQRVVFAKAY